MEMMDHDGPQGLAVSADGYTLVPSSVELTPDTTGPFTFRVIGKDGKRRSKRTTPCTTRSCT